MDGVSALIHSGEITLSFTSDCISPPKPTLPSPSSGQRENVQWCAYLQGGVALAHEEEEKRRGEEKERGCRKWNGKWNGYSQCVCTPPSAPRAQRGGEKRKENKPFHYEAHWADCAVKAFSSDLIPHHVVCTPLLIAWLLRVLSLPSPPPPPVIFPVENSRTISSRHTKRETAALSVCLQSIPEWKLSKVKKKWQVSNDGVECWYRRRHS